MLGVRQFSRQLLRQVFSFRRSEERRHTTYGTHQIAFRSAFIAFKPVTRLTVTELVAVQPPDLLAAFLDLNGYLPIGVPMLKRVLALPGQTVCRNGLTIAVDGIDVGEAHERDGRGRPLPAWHGCRVIADGDVFVMNWQSADSLDSRYFGPLPASAVIGRAVPVWTDEE